MRFSWRTPLFAVLFVVAFAASAPAGAVTVSPSGVYSGTSTGNVVLSLTSLGQTLTCTAASASGTVFSNGTGTLPAGALRFSGCSNPLLGVFTVTQTLAGSGRSYFLTSGSNATGVAADLTIPANGITIATSGGCRFSLGGTVTSLLGTGFPIPLPVVNHVVSTALTGTVTADTLTVTDIPGTGGLCSFLARGLAADLRGSFRGSRNMTISS